MLLLYSLGDEIQVVSQSSWRDEYCTSSFTIVKSIVKCIFEKKVCSHFSLTTYLHCMVYFLLKLQIQYLYFCFSELSVFANNSTKAGVIVETMSAPNPVSIKIYKILYYNFTILINFIKQALSFWSGVTSQLQLVILDHVNFKLDVIFGPSPK